jgi:hypothetical protein
MNVRRRSVFHGICKGTKQSIGKKVDSEFSAELPTTAGTATVESAATAKATPIAGATATKSTGGTAAEATTEAAAHRSPEERV